MQDLYRRLNLTPKASPQELEQALKSNPQAQYLGFLTNPLHRNEYNTNLAGMQRIGFARTGLDMQTEEWRTKESDFSYGEDVKAQAQTLPELKRERMLFRILVVLLLLLCAFLAYQSKALRPLWHPDTASPSQQKPLAPQPMLPAPKAEPRTAPSATPQVQQPSTPTPRATPQQPSEAIPSMPLPYFGQIPTIQEARELQANLVGEWHGPMSSAHGQAQAVLRIQEDNGLYLGTLSFSVPGQKQAQQEVRVTFDRYSGEYEIRGKRWLTNPNHVSLMHLRGFVSQGQFTGTVFANTPTPTDWRFSLRKVR